MSRNDKKLLSIDGCDVRGLLSALVLADLERRLEGRSLAQSFDLTAGTACGGLIALGLAKGLSAAELVEVFMKRSAIIFPLLSLEMPHDPSDTPPRATMVDGGLLPTTREPLRVLKRTSCGRRIPSRWCPPAQVSASNPMRPWTPETGTFSNGHDPPSPPCSTAGPTPLITS